MGAFDPEAHRSASLEQWEGAAPGWARWQALMREFAGPVSEALVDALALQPGMVVLDIAAGVGETGLIAAQRVQPNGRAIIGDQAEAMVRAAQARAQELRVGNVDVRQLNAEWLDLPTASLDAALCRWGIMLMADPGAALRELRRVLRPGGRLAFAVWDTPASNPWASLLALELIERGLMEPPDPGPQPDPGSQPDPKSHPDANSRPDHRPGMFALADPQVLAELIRAAGFVEVDVRSLPLSRRHASFDEFWQVSLDLAPGFHDAVMSNAPAEIEAIEQAVAQRLAPFTAPDGSLAIPAATLIASAGA